MSQIQAIVPSGTQNKFSLGQFEWGFRYEWSANGTRFRVWGHSANPNAPEGSCSSSNATATIRVNNRYVTTTGVTVGNPGTEINAPLVHIPIIME
jgi:hypothetical protein